MTNRRGPWSQEERDYISKHYSHMTADEIAAHIHRDAKAVKKYMKDHNMVTYIGGVSEVEFDIKNSTHWAELKKQFSAPELSTFIYHWNKTIKQFRDDVLHTEELQIIDMIKIELLMNRLLANETEMKKQINEIESLIVQEKQLDKEEQDKERIYNLEKQVVSLYNAIETTSKEYREFLKEKVKILDKLKATREQRIKEIESSKETLTGWVKSLVTRPELRSKLGADMEKMRLAMNVEFERLSEYHKYEDGAIDQPFLTPDNTKGGE